MLHIGSHISIANGFEKAAQTAVEMGADTFQFFTRNPRGGKAKKIDEKDILHMREVTEKKKFAPLLAHAPYTLNLCSDREEIRDFAIKTMSDDFIRLEQIGCTLYNIHPGNHMGQGIEMGVEYISLALNQLIKTESEAVILLETMSGKGTEVGSKFEELCEIINRVSQPEKVGVCLDTCHIFSAGYDIAYDLDGVIGKFDRILGLEKLKAIHLNDSLKPFNSKTDRHALIGEGEIGLEAVIRVINHVELRHLPFFLETPTDEAGHAKEIEILKKNYSF